MTNQKPDKWISNDCKAGMHTSCIALGCEDDCGHAIRTKKVIAVLDDSQPDTTLREEIREVVGRAVRGMSEDPAQSILDLLAKRLPEEKNVGFPPDSIDTSKSKQEIKQDVTSIMEGYRKWGYNQALSEVRTIIEGKNGKSL